MQDVETCYRHGGRRAGVRCQRCERPICPDCMRQASVGFHCPECAGAGPSRTISARQLLGRGQAPVVTNALLALNVAIFFWSLIAGSDLSGSTGSRAYDDYGLIGAAFRPAEGFYGVAYGEWYRLVSGAFLHGGLLHLGMNMYALYILGPQLERALGRVEFLGVYVTALLAGSFGALLLDPFVPTVGASGAIYGLFGGAVVLQRRLGMNPWQSGIAGLIVINLLFTFAVPGISIGGHVGGLIGGAMAASLVLEAIVRRQPALAYVGCLGLAIGFALAGVWAAERAAETLRPVLDFG